MHTFYGLIDGKINTNKIIDKLERKLNLTIEMREEFLGNKIIAFDQECGVDYYITIWEQDENHNNQTYLFMNNTGEAEALMKQILRFFGGQFKANNEEWETIDKTTKIYW